MKKGVLQMERWVRPEVNKETECAVGIRGNRLRADGSRERTGASKCQAEGRMSMTCTAGVAGGAKCVSRVQRSGGLSEFIHSFIPQALMSASCMGHRGSLGPSGCTIQCGEQTY